MHSLHLVDQKFTRRYLPALLARNFLISSAVAMSSFTGSAIIFAHSAWTSPDFVSHLVEQPNARVVSTGTGLPANKASMASRASCVVAADQSILSSMRPWYLNLRS